MRVLVDTNVFLDVALNRAGAPASSQVITACQSGFAEGWVAWHALATMFYLVEKSLDTDKAFRFLTDTLDFFEVPATSTVSAKEALGYGMTDYEDALQLASALACSADAIVTRNKSDFAAGFVQILTPEEFVALP